jgi:hypothetical protein
MHGSFIPIAILDEGFSKGHNLKNRKLLEILSREKGLRTARIMPYGPRQS